MTANRLIFYIYCSAILSIFLPVTVYPLFFSLFIGLNIMSIITENKIVIKRELLIINILVGSFVVISSFSFFLNLGVSDSLQYVKILINMIFLISILHYINYNFSVFLIHRRIFQYLFEFIIFLSFIQIIVNVYTINFWMIPFVGVKDSVMAYRIVDPLILFGTTEKNIWATKIAFIQIIYFSFGYFRYFKVKNIKLYIFWFFSLFNVIYTFSRTAQLVFLLFIIMFVIWKIFYVYKSRILKILSLAIFLLTSIPICFLVYDRLFHITLGEGDGMSARIDIWLALYNHLDSMNIYMGNGILYAKYIITTFTRWPNDNFHNVFLNIFSDQGIIGLLLYIFILRMIFFAQKLNFKLKRFISLVLFLPFFVCVNSHYVGYDNDIVIYFSLVILFIKYLQFTAQESQKVKNINNNPNI